MKKTSRWFVITGFMAVSLLVNPMGSLAVNPEEVIQLRLSNVVPEIHPAHKACLAFKQMVEGWTDGKVQVTIYPANQLGDPPSTILQVMSGTLDINLTGADAWQSFFKEAAVEMIPFAYDDLAHVDRVLAGPAGDAIRKIYEKNNAIRLANWIWGFRQITNNKRPIYKPTDVAGLKMRVPPSFQLQQMYRQLRAVVTTIAFPELYMALSQGVTDGQCNPLWVAWAFKLYEVQKYLALTNHGFTFQNFVMSKARWDTFPEDVKFVIKTSAELAGEYLRAQLAASEEDILRKLQEKGVVITRPDREEFRKLMGPLYQKIGDFAGKEWMDQWMKWVEAARQK